MKQYKKNFIIRLTVAFTYQCGYPAKTDYKFESSLNKILPNNIY